jgi:esterase/lipase superfamily enzyme
MKHEATSWRSPRLERDIGIARWGHFGAPLLVFPTAGGDELEIERMLMIDALAPALEAGRIKVYSVDSVAGRAWAEKKPADYCARLQNAFDACIAEEVVPAIRSDCNDDAIEVSVAGASIGAFNSVASICRHPDLFRLAIAMSGSYDFERLFGMRLGGEFYFASPLMFLPNLGDCPQLEQLRQRFVLLATGTGSYEYPPDSWRMAEVLGGKGVPNRVDAWGVDWHHDWPTWRRMLPQYVDEFFPPEA